MPSPSAATSCVGFPRGRFAAHVKVPRKIQVFADPLVAKTGKALRADLRGTRNV